MSPPEDLMLVVRPDVFYRAFFGVESQVTTASLGHRLSSGLYFGKKSKISIYLGASTTLDEICRKHPNHGVASLPMAMLEQYGITPENDPEDVQGVDLPGHRIFLQNNRTRAEEMRLASVIEVSLVGYTVIGYGQSQGVPNPYARDPSCSL